MTIDINSLLARQYRINIYPLSSEDGGGWFAEIPDLPGCGSDGDTQADALKNIEDAKHEWIMTALELGRPIPKPSIRKDNYSGKILVRAPKSLHRALARQAEEQGVSLNQFIVYLLSKALQDERAMTDEYQRHGANLAYLYSMFNYDYARKSRDSVDFLPHAFLPRNKRNVFALYNE